MRTADTRRLPILLAAAVVLVAAADALARGGGGGNFGGGGGGGGGGGFGGGGGGGGGDLLILLLHLAIRYPVIGIPLLVLFLVFVVVGGKRGRRAQQGSVIRRGRRARHVIAAARAEEELRAADPGFDKAAFLGRVGLAFRKVQEGWCAHDLTPIRPFVSDGIHERFTLQLREQKDLGYRDHVEGLRITDSALAEVNHEGRLEIVTVRVRAVARDYRVSLETGKHVSGSREAAPFEEYWSFLRRKGAKTREDGKGLIEGFCGNCGAPVALNRWAKCEHCEALLRSGEHDWVLVEITQASEWRPRRPVEILGVRPLRERDPGFSVQHLEDRTSVMFWRHAMADRLGDPAPLRKIATDELVDTWRATLDEGRREDGRRYYFGERGVGTVETLGVQLGEKRDRAVIEVRWSGTFFSVDGDGRRRRERKGSIIDTLYVVERRSGVQSDLGTAVSSAHCSHCGAPETGGEQDACEYCGEVMNDGKRDWVLAEVLRRQSPEGRALLRSFQAPAAAEAVGAAPGDDVPPGEVGVLSWMVRTSLADGHVDDKERKRLETFAERAGLQHDRLDRLIEQARGGNLETLQPVSTADARRWIGAAAAVALADGQITGGEQGLLERLAAPHGLAPADVRLVVSQTRSRLYAEAKATLRSRRRR